MADGLFEALSGLNVSAAQNPYGTAAIGIGQSIPQLITPYTSTGRAVGIGLGSVLLQSLLGYQARQQAARETLELNTLANQMQTLATPQERTDFIGGVSDPMYQGRLSTLSTALMQQEAARKLKQSEKLADLTTAAEFEISPLGEQVAATKARREADAKRELVRALTSGGSASTAGAEGAPMPGATEMQQRRDALITRGIAMGMTPNAALEYAEKNTKFETKATGEAGKKIEKARARGVGIEELASKARAGVEGAGMTGGLLAAPRELASKAYAMISPEEQLQRDSQAILNSIKPDLVAIGRSPGNVTDKETEMLIGAGPSILNTPSENIRLVKGMEQLAQLEQDYADFLEAFVTQKGSSIGADAIWRQYKSEQVFPAGVYNPQRQDWASWMTEQGGMAGASAIGEMAQGAGSDVEAQKRELRRQIAEIKAKLGQR
jgi:hypothetical protein